MNEVNDNSEVDEVHLKFFFQKVTNAYTMCPEMNYNFLI